MTTPLPQTFIKYTEAQGTTYAAWSSGEWKQETTGKENHLRSPFLQTEFDEAQADGTIPKDAKGLGGSWSAVSDGELGLLSAPDLPSHRRMIPSATPYH